jgi:hypothetical protein
VRLANADERVTAADRARTGECMERGDGKLRLRERQPRLVAQPGVPAGRCRFEAPRLLVERQQQQRESVGERDLRELGRERPGQQEVLSGERAFELAVRAPLRGHERMFARGLSAADGLRRFGQRMNPKRNSEGRSAGTGGSDARPRPDGPAIRLS